MTELTQERKEPMTFEEWFAEEFEHLNPLGADAALMRPVWQAGRSSLESELGALREDFQSWLGKYESGELASASVAPDRILSPEEECDCAKGTFCIVHGESPAPPEGKIMTPGNEGKDEAQRDAEGSSSFDTGDLRDNRTSAAPLAFPTVVTSEQRKIWIDAINEALGNLREWANEEAQRANKAEAKVSELEAQLQHYDVLRKSDPYEYRVGSCCGDAHMLLESSLEHIKLLGFETETVEEEHCTVTTWHNRRAEKAEAELERMRAGGKS